MPLSLLLDKPIKNTEATIRKTRRYLISTDLELTGSSSNNSTIFNFPFITLEFSDTKVELFNSAFISSYVFLEFELLALFGLFNTVELDSLVAF